MSSSSSSSLKEFATFIPLRLTSSERALLTVLESTLHVSEYTDNVDVSSNRYGYTYGGSSSYSYGGGNGRAGSVKVKRILDGILEACHVATGLSVCGGYDNPNVLMPLLEFGTTDSRIARGSGSGNTHRHRNGHSNHNNEEEDGQELTLGKGYKSRKAAKQADKARKKEMKKLKKLKKKKKKKDFESLPDVVVDDDDNEAAGEVFVDHDDTEPNAIFDNEEEEEEEEEAPQKIQMDRSNDKNSTSENSPSTNNHQYNKTQNSYQNITSIASLTPKENSIFFQNIFEIGRRNKVLNPSKMRATYGKLMHLLQDAQSPTIAKSLGFSLYKDMVMVRPYLDSKGVGSILDDERMVGATMFVRSRDEFGNVIDRSDVEAKVRDKRKLMNELLDEYSTTTGTSSPSSCPTSTITREELQLCIDSISDAYAVVESNVAPVNRMINLLESNFNQNNKEKGFSLELRGSGNSFSSSSNRYGSYGFGAFGSSFMARDTSGPTLSHSHSTQYIFVWQSLHLWKEVQSNMHRLWVCADDDLLSTTTSYQLLNTGQGLNRVQSCPKVGHVMRNLLLKTQRAAGSSWVGLSVIHLGDRDVPNALVFIDKYTQIPRFLKPIADFVDGISEICTDDRIDAYVKSQFGSQRNLKMAVLADYFKHGFDGSGDDGGSCIDGRLTSSWNWTSRIAKKNYYHAFMLSGFQGFDGDFK